MADLEKFSLEKHLADWTQRRESVSVEGTLQEDGDYFVIDRDPRNPCSVLRVRKADVTATEKSRTEHAAGGDRQLYHVSIKKNIPVTQITIISSDLLICSSHDTNESLLNKQMYNVARTYYFTFTVPGTTDISSSSGYPDYESCDIDRQLYENRGYNPSSCTETVE